MTKYSQTRQQIGLSLPLLFHQPVMACILTLSNNTAQKLGVITESKGGMEKNQNDSCYNTCKDNSRLFIPLETSIIQVYATIGHKVDYLGSWQMSRALEPAPCHKAGKERGAI